MKKLWTLMIFLFVSTSSVYADLTAYEIMKQVYSRDVGKTIKSETTMILIEKDKSQRIRELVSIGKNTDTVNKHVIFFLSPPDMKGTAFLTHVAEGDSSSNEQWLYLPGLKKVKRIAGGDRSSSFLGSDFNYSDMGGVKLDDYEYKLLKKEKVDEYLTYRIEATPKTKQIETEYGYRKSIIWVIKDMWIVLKAKNYTTRLKQIKYLQAKNIKKVNGIWTVHRLEMTTKEGSDFIHATIMELKNIEYNLNVDDSLFTQRRLEVGL